MRRITIITPDGKIETRTESDKTTKRPDYFQKIVGGYICLVPHFTMYEGRRCVVFANDNGILQGLPFNSAATALWLKCLGKGPFSYVPRLYGTIAIDQKEVSKPMR